MDEIQNWSAGQLAIAMKLVTPNTRVMDVGDPFQAIFGFGGSDNQSFYNARDALEAKVLRLPVTYRCPVTHVELAKEYVPDYQAAPGAKPGVITRMSKDNMVKHIKPNSRFYSRTNVPVVQAVIEMIENGIGAKVWGKKQKMPYRVFSSMYRVAAVAMTTCPICWNLSKKKKFHALNSVAAAVWQLLKWKIMCAV